MTIQIEKEIRRQTLMTRLGDREPSKHLEPLKPQTDDALLCLLCAWRLLPSPQTLRPNAKAIVWNVSRRIRIRKGTSDEMRTL